MAGAPQRKIFEGKLPLSQLERVGRSFLQRRIPFGRSTHKVSIDKVHLPRYHSQRLARPQPPPATRRAPNDPPSSPRAQSPSPTVTNCVQHHGCAVAFSLLRYLITSLFHLDSQACALFGKSTGGRVVCWSLLPRSTLRFGVDLSPLAPPVTSMDAISSRNVLSNPFRIYLFRKQFWGGVYHSFQKSPLSEALPTRHRGILHRRACALSLPTYSPAPRFPRTLFPPRLPYALLLQLACAKMPHQSSAVEIHQL